MKFVPSSVVATIDSLLTHFIENNSVSGLEALAAWPDLPAPYLGRLSAPENPSSVIATIASRKDAPEWLLETLAKMKNVIVNNAIAKNPAAPGHLLEELSHSSDHEVLTSLAGNPNTPVGVLVKISQKSNDEQAYVLARNPGTPLNVLLGLLVLYGDEVSEAVMSNPNFTKACHPKMLGSK